MAARKPKAKKEQVKEQVIKAKRLVDPLFGGKKEIVVTPEQEQILRSEVHAILESDEVEQVAKKVVSRAQLITFASSDGRTLVLEENYSHQSDKGKVFPLPKMSPGLYVFVITLKGGEYDHHRGRKLRGAEAVSLATGSHPIQLAKVNQPT